MSEEQQPEERIKKRKFVTRYSRPIEFVASESSPKKRKATATVVDSSDKINGDKVASFYRSIVSSPSIAATASSSTKKESKEKELEPKEKPTEETMKCESCDMTISKSDYKRHIQGTAHMVSNQAMYPLTPDILTLNGSNVGFRMLQSQGWQYEQGLGPDSQGRRHPIATVLKQDRLGIGHQDTGKKVVTHRYKEIEKRAIERQRMLAESQKDPGKEIAKQSKAESEKRVAILRYMKE
ncbi:Pyrimidine nucleotide transporter, mitochondrial [Mucor velutinosus]|uniref:Pyrimidine nucleotide transporter, mitochondrial n=1 Tax=Mucor velutinosus TaxID=708070 RepID=A0AAN7HPG0_9FUNG|nr:Pyrimidine nucleotide transporter, mitochondrial [Mucor velutinosus]